MPHTIYPPATSEDLAQTVKEVEALDRRIVAICRVGGRSERATRFLRARRENSRFRIAGAV